MRKDISDEELFRKWDEEADILEERCLAADRNDWGAMMECWEPAPIDIEETQEEQEHWKNFFTAPIREITRRVSLIIVEDVASVQMAPLGNMNEDDTVPKELMADMDEIALLRVHPAIYMEVAIKEKGCVVTFWLSMLENTERPGTEIEPRNAALKVQLERPEGKKQIKVVELGMVNDGGFRRRAHRKIKDYTLDEEKEWELDIQIMPATMRE